MEFKKAVKTKQRLRLAIDGVSGSGKTFTALAVASGMGGPIAVIDSEHGSASLYADRVEFDTLELMEFQIENYIDALNSAAAANYPIVIIDSTSHAWDALVARVERIASQKYGMNTFRAWAEGTPLQSKLIEAMLSYPGHVIVTCRSKTEYSVDKDDKGKTTIKKVGTAAVQRQGFEYEFTMAMTMDANHIGLVTKDRTGKFQDKFLEKPGKEFGQQLIAWLNEGNAPAPKVTPPAAADGNKPRNERQTIIDEIVKVLTAKSPDCTDFFSDEERATAKNNIRAAKEIGVLKKLADSLKQELEKRQAEYEPIPFGNEDDDLSALTAPDKEPPPEENPPAAAETPPAEEEFKDDIPWKEGEEPGAGNGRKSLQEEFQKAKQKNAQEKASAQTAETAGSETATAGELDIF